MTDPGEPGEVVIAPAGPADEWDADWSPDGSQLLYTKDNASGADIWRMNPDGTGRRAVIDSADKADTRAQYLPDGTGLVYTTATGGDPEIRRSLIDGSGQVNLTSNPASDVDTAIQPINETETVVTAAGLVPESGKGLYSATYEFGPGPSFVAASYYQCRMDGGAWEACSSPKTYNNLGMGTEHVFEVKGTSNGVTESPASYTSGLSKGKYEEPPAGLALLTTALRSMAHSLFDGEHSHGASSEVQQGSSVWAQSTFDYSKLQPGANFRDSKLTAQDRSCRNRLRAGGVAVKDGVKLYVRDGDGCYESAWVGYAGRNMNKHYTCERVPDPLVGPGYRCGRVSMHN